MPKGYKDGIKLIPPKTGGWNKGRKFSEESRRKMSNSHMGISRNSGKDNPFFGKKHTEEHKRKLKESNRHLPTNRIAYERILKEVPALEAQGFRCIPIGKVIPDIIGIKDGKVYAIEVEYSYQPNYGKYTEETSKHFDDIIWIIRRKEYNPNV